MEQIIADFLKQYGLVGIGVAFFLFLFTNSSFISLLTRLIVYFPKPKDTSPIIRYNKFKLLKLIRQPPDKRRRVTATIFNVLLLAFFTYSYYVFINNNSGDTATVAAKIGIFFSLFFIGTTWMRNTSTLSLKVDGDSEDLFRTYQSMLFDMNMHVLSFDAQKRKIEASLNGNEITITVEGSSGTENEVTLTRTRDFFGTLFYSKEYERNIRKLINEPYYPKINLEPPT